MVWLDDAFFLLWSIWYGINENLYQRVILGSRWWWYSMAFENIWWYMVRERYLNEDDVYRLTVAFPHFNEIQIFRDKSLNYIKRRRRRELIYSCTSCDHICSNWIEYRSHLRRRHKQKLKIFERFLQIVHLWSCSRRKL